MIADPNTPFQHLPIGQVIPSKTNPRKRFPEDKLQELADNIRQHGVMQPILVRPIDKRGQAILNGDFDGGTKAHSYEIVAGERRYRASRLASEEFIPAIVRPLRDLEAMQLQVFENLHRDDLHPMEEAEGFQRLLDKSQDLIGLTVDELAAKIGKSRAYIYASLKLLALCEEGRDAFFEGKIGKETAVLIARIPGQHLQKKALGEITHTWIGGVMSYREAASHVHGRYTLNLARAQFDLANGQLVAEAGDCQHCPKCSGNNRDLYADIESLDVCTDPDCFESKRLAHAEALKHSGAAVIFGEEAKKIMPYGANSYLQGDHGYSRSTDSARGLRDSWEKTLGDDMPPPVILIDHKHNTVNLYRNEDLQQKLQEKIAAGEVSIDDGENQQEPSEWEIKRAERDAKLVSEQKRRNEIYARIDTATLNDMPDLVVRLAIIGAIRIIDDQTSGSALALVKESLRQPESLKDDEWLGDYLSQGSSVEDLQRLLCLLIASEGTVIGYGWDPEDEDKDPELDRLESLAIALGIDPDEPAAAKTPPDPFPAARANEISPPDPVQPAEPLPVVPEPFAKIREKKLAKLASKKKESATADGVDLPAATAAGSPSEETAVAA